MPRKTKNLVGCKFAKLIVNAFAYRNQQGTYWYCLCECGGTTTTRYGSLTSGNTKSCGCIQKESANKTIKKQIILRTLPVGAAAQRDLFRQYKKSAKVRKLDFYLTLEQFLKLTSKRCFYCNIEPLQTHKNSHWNGSYLYNGLDRRNNQLGYTIKNAVPCCKRCNIAKMDTTEKEFLAHVKQIYTFKIKS